MNKDQTAAFFITLLLMISKHNARMQREMNGSKSVADPETLAIQSKKASQEHFQVMELCLRTFNQDPLEMEREVLGFARAVGFTVEQHYIGNASKSKH